MKKRFRFDSLTLAVTALVLLACVIGSKLGIPSLPASVEKPAADTIYAISYSVTDKYSLAAAEQDIAYIKSKGMSFKLPSDLRSVKGGGMILIFELRSGGDVENIIELLKKTGARAVISVTSYCDKSIVAKINDAAGAGIAELACAFETCSDAPVDMIAAFAEARLEFLSRHGTDASVFVHSCGKLHCTRAAAAMRDPGSDIFIFGYGSGKNLIELPCRGVTGLERIQRLPEWTIEDYFDSIAN